MNLREFVKSIVGKTGAATPEIARQIVETLKAVAIADSPEVKKMLYRQNNTAAMGSPTFLARRREARRVQKESRRLQRRAGTYGRAQ